MRRLLGCLALLAFALFGSAAQAGIDVQIDLAAQRMQVTTSDGEAYNWKISSGRKGFRTPSGVYRPIRLEKSWYSRKYDGAMPHSVFFHGGYAIHGTTAVGALGRPASHGCIRLHPANAAKFFALVKKHGYGQTRIALNGSVNDSLSRFARASTNSKAKLAKTSSSDTRIASAKVAKAKIVRAQQRYHDPIVVQQRQYGWEAARGQILLRPSLPANAYGYQPYYAYPSSGGWR